MRLLTGSATGDIRKHTASHQILSSAVFLSAVINNHEIDCSRPRIVNKVNIIIYIKNL